MRRCVVGFLCLFLLLIAPQDSEAIFRRRRRRSPPPPPRCTCTPSNPNINTNPLGLQKGGANVCIRTEYMQYQYCEACSCGQCLKTRNQAFQFLQCCGGWSQTGNTCSRANPCNGVTPANNANHSPSKSVYSVGEVVRYTCRTSYRMTSGSVTTTCQLGPKWSSGPPVCSPIPCGNPYVPLNANIAGGAKGSYPVGGSADFGCNGGYRHTGGATRLTCQLGPSWTGSSIQCKPVCFGNVDVCQNGGVCVKPDFCDRCNRGYASPKCNPCPKIDNCAMSVCEYPAIGATLKCDKCKFDYGAGNGRAYEVSPDRRSCLKRCSWRPDSNVCYPGTCGLIGTCDCAPGFGAVASQCNTIMEMPRISPGFLRFYYGGKLNGQHSLVNITESLSAGGRIYSNADNVKEIEIDISANYIKTPPQRPPYVTRVILGLTKFQMDLHFQKESTKYPVLRITPAINKFGIIDRAFEVSKKQSLATVCSGGPCPIRHNDRFLFRTESMNGGHIIVKNWETNAQTQRDFVGKQSARSLDIIVDQEKPYHCSKIASCSTPALDLGIGFSTVDKAVQTNWPGWTDKMSGLSRYQLEVIEMMLAGNNLVEGHGSQTRFHKEMTFNKDTTNTVVNLPKDRSAVYAFKLSVCDTVIERLPNCEHTRRFIFIDNGTQVTVNPDKNSEMTIANTVKTDNQIWLRTLDNKQPNVLIKWTDHFANLVHQRLGLLQGIQPWPQNSEDSFYDHKTGDRNINKIASVRGIVKFETQFKKDKSGGNTLTSPDGAWKSVANFQTESESLSISRQDGDSVRVWVRATDIMKHQAGDSILFHVDASPAEIGDIYLVKNGRKNISVHNSRELYNMSLHWTARDIHSGLYTVKWELLDLFTGQELLHGESKIGHQGYPTMQECLRVHHQDCYCTPATGCYYPEFNISPMKDSTLKPNMHLSEHDYDLHFRITVTNNAQLVTVKTFKISIDTTGPHPGTVHIGTPGQPDIEFQPGTSIRGHWGGFVDKESGVQFYRYKFDSRCALVSELTPQNSTETTDTFANWNAPGPGTYYLTVAAFNPSLQPSAPVCTRAVTVDNIPPTMTSISIDRLRTKPGLITGRMAPGRPEEVWLVTKEHRLHKLTQSSVSVCQSYATARSDIELFPSVVSNPGQKLLEKNMSNEECARIGAFGNAGIVDREAPLVVTFVVDDPQSGVEETFVGLASSENGAPDLLGWTPSNGHQQFTIRATKVQHGSRFYVKFRVRNKAGLNTEKVMGPVIVDSTPPGVSGTPKVVKRTRSNVVISWDADMFSDGEDPYPLRYSIAVGSHRDKTDVVAFTKLSWGPECPEATPPVCSYVSLPAREKHETFYFKLRVVNTVGFHTFATSSAFEDLSEAPKPGIVLITGKSGLDPNDIRSLKESHFQSDSAHLNVVWYGFESSLDTKLYVAVGTNASMDDVSPFQELSSNFSGSTTVSSLSLSNFQSYIVTVKSVNAKGEAKAQASSVTIIPRDTTFDFQVLDGEACQLNSVAYIQHHKKSITTICPNQLGYQASTSSFTIRWTKPSQLSSSLYSRAKILLVLQERESISEGTWKQIAAAVLPGVGVSQHIFSQLTLKSGSFYRGTVQFCFEDVCGKELASQGLYINPHKPFPGGFTVQMISSSQVSFVLDKFTFQDETKDSSNNAMLRYEWTIADATADQTISKWSDLSDANNLITTNLTHIYGTIDLGLNVTFSRCYYLLVKGFGKNGLSSIVSRELKDCREIARNIVPNVVIDALGPVKLEKNARWLKADLDYSKSTNQLSAVWPTLRHGRYAWAVIESPESTPGDNTLRPSPKLVLPSPCDHPLAVKCGEVTTDQEFVNIHDLSLKSGKRYHVCIHANATVKVFERFRQPLPAVSACSDGVTVDTLPPIPGIVSIGWGRNEEISASQTTLFIKWSQFSDVESSGKAVHHSGISRYYYKIGYTPGGDEVVSYTNIGITDHMMLSGLKLSNGQKYYVTIKAENFVNLTTEVTSKPILIDHEAPRLNSSKIVTVGDTQGILSDLQSVALSWDNVFWDGESGITSYQWCIGTQPNLCNVIGTTETLIESPVVRLNNLRSGMKYFLTVYAFDRIGHSAVAVSSVFFVDTTPPNKGKVYHGHTGVKDMTYQMSGNSMTAWWEGFHDPESVIVLYSVSIGSCDFCDDVLEATDVAIRKEATFHHLNLQAGVRYFTTVEACNRVGLCSKASSNQMMIDFTPPTKGSVVDGDSDSDTDYSSHRNLIAASLIGFTDAESGLGSIIWCIGTRTSTCDITMEQKMPMMNFFRATVQTLPLKTKLFLNVQIFNHAGMSTNASSNGFVVDVTPPTFLNAISLDTNFGTLIDGTQILPTVLNVTWAVNDNESYVEELFLSLVSHRQGHVVADSIRIPGRMHSYLFSSLELRDGYVYMAKLVACNRAKLCAVSTSGDIKVDSSPPHVGMFAVSTRHTIQQHDRNMTWTSRQITVAWSHFYDLHSGLTNACVSVGTDYMQDDLVKETPQPYASSNVQEVTLPLLKSIKAGDNIYISLSAENGVGLRSHILHSSFLAESSGRLALVRRCNSVSCLGHCVCAPLHQSCATTSQCTDLTGSDTVKDAIVVIDSLRLRDIRSSKPNIPDEDNQADSCTLAATWIKRGSTSFQRFEMSAGLASATKPSGLFDALHERVWFDVGQKNFGILNLTQSAGKCMKPYIRYKFFLRAWISASSFALFTSDGVTVLTKPPKVQISRGVAVRESIGDVSESVMKDMNFVPESTNVMTVAWKSKFAEYLVGTLRDFTIYLSRTRNGSDTLATSIVPADRQIATLRNLQFEHGREYFSAVMACNKAGLCSSASSNGFIADSTPPSRGYVIDSFDGLVDKDYQSLTTTIASAWSGFWDPESYVSKYFWCVGLSNAEDECSVVTWQDVGLKTRAKANLTTSLKHGANLFNKVYAVNAAGLKSPVGISDEVMIDTTPPVVLEACNSGSNLLSNPGLVVTGSSQIEIKNLNDDWWKGNESKGTLTDWSKTDLVTAVANIKTGHTVSGSPTLLALHGGIRQRIATQPGAVYRITLAVTDLEQASAATRAFRIMAEKDHILQIHGSPPNTSIVYWQQKVFYFTALKETTEISISTLELDSSGLGFDAISVTKCGVTGAPSEVSNPGLHVGVHLSSSYVTMVHASWSAEDTESGIDEIYVALGTSIGGIQILPYKRLGGHASVFDSNPLSLPPGSRIHVSLVLVNRAGLYTVQHAPATPPVDFQPPRIHGPVSLDGCLDDCVVRPDSVKAKVTLETPVEELRLCEVAFGTSTDRDDLQKWKTLKKQELVKNLHFELASSSGIRNGARVFPIVRCQNVHGMVATRSMKYGYLVISQPPSADGAFLHLVTPSTTSYRRNDPFIPSTNEFAVVWEGFHDITGISFFEYSLKHQNDSRFEWKTVGGGNTRMLQLRGLSLHLENSYNLTVRAVNRAGLRSKAVSTDLIPSTTSPEFQNFPPSANWTAKTVDINWASTFSYAQDLLYEVTIGTGQGQGNVLSMWESVKPWIQITDLDKEDDYYIVICAVAKSGYFTRKQFKMSKDSIKVVT